MDHRLEPLDSLIANMDEDELDLDREAQFAVLSIDWTDPATLRWAAAVLALRADELES